MKNPLAPVVVVALLWSSALVAMDVPVILSPSRMSQSITDSPSAVTVIDREIIEATGVRKLADVLRLVPGMFSGSRFGNLPAVGFHGLSDSYPRRIQVLVDGRSAWQPLTGGVFWLTMPVPIENIDRIEVIRGPNGASYGSSAFSATINIITNHSSESVGSKITLTKGGEGIADVYAHHGGVSERLGYALSLSRQGDDGFDEVNDTRQDDLFLGRLDFAATEYDELMFQFGFSDSAYGAGDGSFESPFRDINQRDDFQHFKWTRALTSSSDLVTTFARHHFENNHRHLVGPFTAPPVGNMIFDYTYEGDRLDADIQYTSLVSEKTRVVIGGGLREDSMYSPAFLDTNSTLHNKTVMAQGQMEHRFTPGVILNLGAMWEDSDQISPVWSPRAALILHPSEPHTVRIAYNSGSRQGMTREEKVRQSVINEAGTFKLYKEYASGGLEPEKVETVEIGYRFDSQRFTVDSRIYRDKATDLITAFLTAAPVGLLGYYTNFTEVMDYRNEDAVTIKGFELDAEWRPTSQDRLRLIYAHTDIKQDAPSYLDYSASAPENQYGLLYTRQMPNGWSVSAFYTWVDKMAWLAQPEIDEYDRLDVRLAKRTRLSASNVTVELVGQGINSRHADFDPANEWSPVYFVRAKLEL